jgi:succinate dehydrogenase / fumarate reductase cytochrome b subunit
MTINFFAIKGPEAYQTAINFLHNIPLLWVAEILLIALPILFHAFYGIYIVYLAKNNVLQYNYFRNWTFYLQRITAVITLIFITVHVNATTVSRFTQGTEVGFGMMVDILANPVALVFYLVGLVAAFYHFANGLWTFLITWGITIGPVSQKYSSILCTGIFVILNIVGIMALLAFVR